MTVDRIAFATLVVLALCVGLGDIASVTSVDAVMFTGVRGLLPLAIAMTLLATLLKRRLPAFPSRLALPAAAWLAVLVVSAALAPSNRFEALASLERTASGALLAWAVYDLCRSRARWRLLAKAAAMSGLAIALAGLAEAIGVPPARDWLAALHDGSIPIGDVPRIASTLSHPNEAAMLLELSLPLLVAWAWTASRPWRVPLALAALSTLVAMVLTFSRAGVVAGLLGLSVMAALCVVRGERRPLLSLSAAVLAVPVALICAAVADQGLDRRLTAELGQDSALANASAALSPQAYLAGAPSAASPGVGLSTQPSSARTQSSSASTQSGTASTASSPGPQPSRMEFWTAALDMFRDHPLLGVGPDNFRWRFASYSGVPADNLGIHAHDQYLEALADTGVLGLLSLGWLLVRLVRNALDGVHRATASTDWPWRAALLASLTAWLLHALLDDFERFWPASVAFWLLAGLNLRLPDQQPTRRGDSTTTGLKAPQRAAAAAALLIVVGTACGQVGAAHGDVIAYVNGEPTTNEPSGIALLDHELIQLDVGQDTPPQPFTFPPRL